MVRERLPELLKGYKTRFKDALISIDDVFEGTQEGIVLDVRHFLDKSDPSDEDLDKAWDLIHYNETAGNITSRTADELTSTYLVKRAQYIKDNSSSADLVSFLNDNMVDILPQDQDAVNELRRHTLTYQDALLNFNKLDLALQEVEFDSTRTDFLEYQVLLTELEAAGEAPLLVEQARKRVSSFVRAGYRNEFETIFSDLSDEAPTQRTDELTDLMFASMQSSGYFTDEEIDQYRFTYELLTDDQTVYRLIEQEVETDHRKDLMRHFLKRFAARPDVGYEGSQHFSTVAEMYVAEVVRGTLNEIGQNVFDPYIALKIVKRAHDAIDDLAETVQDISDDLPDLSVLDALDRHADMLERATTFYQDIPAGTQFTAADVRKGLRVSVDNLNGLFVDSPHIIDNGYKAARDTVLNEERRPTGRLYALDSQNLDVVYVEFDKAQFDYGPSRIRMSDGTLRNGTQGGIVVGPKTRIAPMEISELDRVIPANVDRVGLSQYRQAIGAFKDLIDSYRPSA